MPAGASDRARSCRTAGSAAACRPRAASRSSASRPGTNRPAPSSTMTSTSTRLVVARNVGCCEPDWAGGSWPCRVNGRARPTSARATAPHHAKRRCGSQPPAPMARSYLTFNRITRRHGDMEHRASRVNPPVTWPPCHSVNSVLWIEVLARGRAGYSSLSRICRIVCASLTCAGTIARNAPVEPRLVAAAGGGEVHGQIEERVGLLSVEIDRALPDADRVVLPVGRGQNDAERGVRAGERSGRG